MATTEEYRQHLRAAIEGTGDLGPASEAELERITADHAAEILGVPRPPRRTAIDLRIHGAGVDGHDVDLSVAGVLLQQFAALVKEVAARTRRIRTAPRMFISPNVRPGSTILTVFGSPLEPPPEDEPLNVIETPLDRTMVEVFAVFAKVRGLTDTSQPADMNLNRHVGDRVFGLANDLLDNELDLDINWTRFSGRSEATSIDRATARRVKAVLDRPVSKSDVWNDPGRLVSISTDGSIRVEIVGRKWRVVDVVAPTSELENLRGLFGSEVRLRYRRTVTRHPSRSADDVSYDFLAIGPFRAEPAATDDVLL